MSATLDRVTFAFSDGTTVSFSHSPQRWISWTASVSTTSFRGRESEIFSDECLQPTLIHAQRLIVRAIQKRKESDHVGVGTKSRRAGTAV